MTCSVQTLAALVRAARSLFFAAALAACTAYDAALISGEPQGVAMVPRTDNPPAAGSGAGSGQPTEVAAAGGGSDRDAEVPPGASEVHCGDGRVTGEEKCDIGIPADAPGSCPTQCPPLAACNPRALNNSGCQAECVLLQLVCTGGDACCPGKCTAENDTDCSSHCGDGLVQPDAGETCEAESSTPCKRSDAECNDGDPCTLDKLVGSASNCNALCTHTRVTAAKGGDGCCLPDSDANSDADCKPQCGNGVREAGEDCDGTTGCSSGCKLTLQPEQQRCLERLGDAADECAKCSCMNCLDSYNACSEPADSSAARRCTAVLECARTNDCFGTACYCGDAFLCVGPNGSCRTQIEAAAGSTDSNVITVRANDPATTLGKAYMADTCRTQQCRAQCR